MAAATAESTPPDKPQITLLLPIISLAFAISFSAIFAVVHVGVQPAILSNQFFNIA